MSTQVEICYDSHYDARQTETGGAKRIELNSALYIGGLTPSMATLHLTKEHTKLSVMTVIRPRGAGFHYPSQDYNVMVEETRDMIRNGADGIIFGCLDTYGNIDTEQSGYITALAKVDRKQVVFHRAFNCVKDPSKAMEAPINVGVDRVLTSGTYPTAFEGEEITRQLQECYDDRIEILAGCGIDATNTKELTAYTGVEQIHSSCKSWLQDKATCGERVAYSYGPQGHKSDYEVANSKEIEHLIWNVWQPSAE